MAGTMAVAAVVALMGLQRGLQRQPGQEVGASARVDNGAPEPAALAERQASRG